MHTLITFLSEQLHNQFLSGGLVLLVGGGLMGLLRNSPRQIWHWLKRRTTIEVEVLNSDPLFDYVTIWLDHQPYSKRSRRLTGSIANPFRDY